MLPQKMIMPSRILGYRSNGCPIWEIRGGSEGAGDAGGGDGGQGAGDGAGGDQGGQQQGQGDGGGDQGAAKTYTQADFDRMQAALDKERGTSRANAAAAKELAALRKSQETDQERAVTEAREQATKDASAQFTTRLANLSIQAAAAGKFQNPKVAQAMLRDRHTEFVGDDGEVDDAAITKAVDQLLKDDPYLGTKKPPADFDGGQRGGASGSTDMNSMIRRQVGGR